MRGGWTWRLASASRYLDIWGSYGPTAVDVRRVLLITSRKTI